MLLRHTGTVSAPVAHVTFICHYLAGIADIADCAQVRPQNQAPVCVCVCATTQENGTGVVLICVGTADHNSRMGRLLWVTGRGTLQSHSTQS